MVVDLPDAVARQIAATGRVAVGCSCDVSQSSAVKGMIDRAVEVWGRLDIVVNNAMWMGKGGPAAGCTAVQWNWQRSRRRRSPL